MELSSTVTVAGNLTRDPEVRSSTNGMSIARIGLAISQRKFNRDTNAWEDGETTFLTCTAFGQLADHIATSFSKGQRIIAVGQLRTNSWVDKDSGTQRSTLEMVLDEAGASVKFGTVAFAKAGAPPQRQQPVAQNQADAWANSGVDTNTPW